MTKLIYKDGTTIDFDPSEYTLEELLDMLKQAESEMRKRDIQYKEYKEIK